MDHDAATCRLDWSHETSTVGSDDQPPDHQDILQEIRSQIFLIGVCLPQEARNLGIMIDELEQLLEEKSQTLVRAEIELDKLRNEYLELVEDHGLLQNQGRNAQKRDNASEMEIRGIYGEQKFSDSLLARQLGVAFQALRVKHNKLEVKYGQLMFEDELKNDKLKKLKRKMNLLEKSNEKEIQENSRCDKERLSLHNAVLELKEEHQELEDKYYKLGKEHDQLKAKHKVPTYSYELLKQKYQDLEKEKKCCEHRLKESRNELLDKARQLDGANRRAENFKEQSKNLLSENKKLQESRSNVAIRYEIRKFVNARRIQALEDDLAIKEPLVKIGTAIRLRFLGQLDISDRQLLLPEKSILRRVVMDGNRAAHYANNAADVALFQSKLVPQEMLERANNAYMRLYNMTPDKYASDQVPILRMVLDCQATVASLHIVNESRESQKDREYLETCVLEIWEHASTRSKEDIMHCSIVKSLLESIITTTNEIVQANRKR